MFTVNKLITDITYIVAKHEIHATNIVVRLDLKRAQNKNFRGSERFRPT